jgi:hypothetical protein
MTPMEGILKIFERLLGANKTSRMCFEIGPKYEKQGAVETYGQPFLDAESAIVFDKLYERTRQLHGRRYNGST